MPVISIVPLAELQHIPDRGITLKDVAKSIAIGSAYKQIKQAATDQTSVKDIQCFGNGWQQNKKLLVQILEEYKGIGNRLYRIYEVYDGHSEYLNLQRFTNAIESLRVIELQVQMDEELELGLISSPRHFKPRNEDWTGLAVDMQFLKEYERDTRGE